jgi:hypothetical protein
MAPIHFLVVLMMKHISGSKPYTEIDGTDTFSGRTYDEAYIGQFIAEHRLPCNTTTAFLTPALRNRSEPLTPNTNLVGRPQEVNNYAKSLYEKTGGVEIAVLDCISFLRHFLHLFHRSRTRYVEEYQQLVLNEPDSAVSQPLKELWLSLRSAAESGLGNGESSFCHTAAYPKPGECQSHLLSLAHFRFVNMSSIQIHRSKTILNPKASTRISGRFPIRDVLRHNSGLSDQAPPRSNILGLSSSQTLPSVGAPS